MTGAPIASGLTSTHLTGQMSITSEALARQAELDRLLAGIVDEQTRDLTRAWALAWDEVAGDLRETVQQIVDQQTAGHAIPRSWFARSTRLGTVLVLVGHQLELLASQSGIRVVRDLHQVVTDAAVAQRDIIAAMLPPSTHVPGGTEYRALDAIVRRSTEQITSQLRPLSAEAEQAVRRELIRGVAAGIGPRDVADLMVKRAEHGFNGGLTRALTISRTETIDAHREAAQHAQAAHADVLTGWVWLAHLSPRTCRSCIAMNGTVHPLSEPGPFDHQQGRCSRAPQTKSWADLGIDLPEPADQVPDSDTWFAALSPAEQQAILGVDGYRAWKAGRWPMSAWSTRRTTRGWRESHVPAKPPRR